MEEERKKKDEYKSGDLTTVSTFGHIWVGEAFRMCRKLKLNLCEMKNRMEIRSEKASAGGKE
jgi:hypothetical protein